MEQRNSGSPARGGRSFGSSRPRGAGGASSYQRGGFSRGGDRGRGGSSSGAPRTGGYTGGASRAPRTGGFGGSSQRPSTGGGYAARSSYNARAASASTDGARAPYRGGERSSYTPREGGYRGGSSAGTSTPSRGGYQGSRPYEGSNPRPSSRPSFGGGRDFGGRSGGGFSRGGRGGGGGRGGNRGMGEKIDPNRYINKAVITEEIEHFVPEHMFTDFKIGDTLKKAITIKGYTAPTPIQDRSIPHILQGVDVVGIANTGTGKTGAFLIPLIDKVLKEPKHSVLIVVPTRELAIQIEEELQGFVKNLAVKSVCAFGGANISRQIEALKTHRHFVIGTPGRLKDLLVRKKLNTAQFRTVVLDEADRMLDMGFVHDMRTLLAGVPKDRQTLFFSATLSSEIEKLISEFLNEPVRISVKTRDTSKNIDQDVIRVPRGADKFDILVDLLKKPDFSRVLVFGRTKHGVDALERKLVRGGITAESIHGNKNNSKRQQALRLFKEGKVRVLVATDVAARGLDIANVTHVINFDVPATYDDYVHRIGRTGRGANKGSALTMIEG